VSATALWAGGLLVAGLAALGYGTWVEPDRAEVTRTCFYLPRWPRGLDGFRIVQVSDWHGRTAFRGIPLHRWVNELAPDLVAVTGDLVDDGRDLDRATAELRAMDAPLGVYFVTGNHDLDPGRRGPGLERLARALESAGVVRLANSGRRLLARGESFWLAGVEDPSLHRDDLAAALRGRRADEAAILLAHAPMLVERAAVAGVDLVLGGHTHGGQVRLPALGSLALRYKGEHRYVAGRYRVGATELFVTRGVGTVILPVRFLCRPEVSLLLLRAGHGPAKGVVPPGGGW